jgi:hypothetical protein
MPVLHAEFQRCGALQRVLLRYLHRFIIETLQTTLCNRLHTTQERLSRWLLLMHDQVQTDEFDLSGEALALMLSEPRSRAVLAARTLHEAGLIHYDGGHARILHREGLEDSACECYEIIRQRADHLLQEP